MSAISEKSVGCVLVAGLVVTLVSGGLTWVFSVAGVYRGTYTREPLTNKITDAGAMNFVPLTITGMAIGVLMMGGAIGYGLWANANASKGNRKTVPHAKIIARYGYSRQGQMLNADYELEAADNPRYYVRMQLSPTDIAEYECAEQAYFQAGEGMVGEADIQGKWLGAFRPYIGGTPPI